MLSKHPFVRVAQIACIREDDMVKESDVKDFAGFLEFACDGIVTGAGHHVALRVVVAEDYARGMGQKSRLQDDTDIHNGLADAAF